MSVTDAPAGSGGPCTFGRPTADVFTLNRLFCRYCPPNPAAAAAAAVAPPAMRNLRRLTARGACGGVPVPGMSVRITRPTPDAERPVAAAGAPAAHQARFVPSS